MFAGLPVGGAVAEWSRDGDGVDELVGVEGVEPEAVIVGRFSPDQQLVGGGVEGGVAEAGRRPWQKESTISQRDSAPWPGAAGG